LITLHASPLKGNIYVQPYKYGQIFKLVEDFNRSELAAGTLSERDVAKQLERKTELLESVSQYFEQDFVGLSQELIIYSIPFFIAIAFSFLGALVYALKDATYRLHTSDLYAKTFISYLIRFVFSLSLSIAIAYFLMNNWWINAAPVIFLLIGFFPQRALQYMEEKAMTLLRLQKEEKEDIPLSRIQGMTDYKIYRFREIGVGDVQNLAKVDLSYLKQNLSYNCRLLCDFVSQAILVIHLGAHLEVLRGFGVRDVFSFRSTISDANCEEIAKLLNIPAGKLRGFLETINKPPMKARIENILSWIDWSTESEEKELTKMGRLARDDVESADGR
jgi:hypothetical protein